MKIILIDNKLILKSKLAFHAFRIILAFLLSIFFAFLAFQDLNNISIVFLCAAIAIFIFSLYLSFKKRLYRLIIDKSSNSISLVTGNLFNKDNNDYPIDAITGINTDSSFERFLTNSLLTYHLYIELYNVNIYIYSSIREKHINKTIDAITRYLDKADIKINASNIVYNPKKSVNYNEVLSEANKTNDSNITYTQENTTTYSKAPSTTNKNYKAKSNSLLGKEIFHKIDNNKLELTMRTPIDTLIILIFLAFLASYFLTASYKVSISEINYIKLLILPVICLIAIIINAFLPCISKLIIDKEYSKIQIFYKGFKSNKYEEYPIQAIKTLDSFAFEGKHRLLLELNDKKIELGVLQKNEILDQIRKFMNNI